MASEPTKPIPDVTPSTKSDHMSKSQRYELIFAKACKLGGDVAARRIKWEDAYQKLIYDTVDEGEDVCPIIRQGLSYGKKHCGSVGSFEDEKEKMMQLEACMDEKSSQADRIVQAATKEGTELWHTPQGESYLTFEINGHREHHGLRSKASKNWLSLQLYRSDNKAPSSQAMQDALNVLEGKAIYEGLEYPVFVRMARYEDSVIIDIGDDTWEAIEITASGWQVITDPPIRFKRPRSLMPLPRPEEGGSWEDLRALLNISDERHWSLLLSWLVQAYWPEGPYAHLILTGEQGSGKTKLTWLLKQLVDPSRAALRRPPKSERDLMIAAQAEHILAYDNLSGLKIELSDAFCCLSSGGTLAGRKLYTDDDEALLTARKPAILNGIDSIATRGDLLDRSIIVDLPSIPEEARRKEKEITAEFEKLHPALLGLILDVTVTGLRRVSQVDIPNLPRMADFFTWILACEPALPWEEGDFLRIYGEARNDSMATLVETDRFANAVYRLVNGAKTFSGTATDLLTMLNKQEGIYSNSVPRGWPKVANSVKDRLKRVAPQLRASGVLVAFDRTGKARRISLQLSDDSKSESSQENRNEVTAVTNVTTQDSPSLDHVEDEAVEITAEGDNVARDSPDTSGQTPTEGDENKGIASKLSPGMKARIWEIIRWKLKKYVRIDQASGRRGLASSDLKDDELELIKDAGWISETSEHGIRIWWAPEKTIRAFGLEAEA